MKAFSYTRFSTPEQKKGSSAERQIENAKTFAEVQGWDFDESMSMKDEGLSAFHGTHSEVGELGIFLQAVRENKIETPCVLIIEDVDRLSRQNPLSALQQFNILLQANITVATLHDQQIFTAESMGNSESQLMLSVMKMMTAHQESQKKSLRINDAFGRRREKVHHAFENGRRKIVVNRCPGWLQVNKAKDDFEQIPHHVKTVKRIFNLYDAGSGIYTIMTKLNQSNTPSFGRCDGKVHSWGRTQVRRILRNRAIIGEFTFKTTDKIVKGYRKYIPIGEPIQGYYPRIIEQKMFDRVQIELTENAKPPGQIGEANNLFKGLVKCGYCFDYENNAGLTMQYATSKGYKYLTCKNSIKKTSTVVCGKGSISFKYEDFEDAFLQYCNKLNLASIVTDDFTEIERKIKLLEDEKSAIQGKVMHSKATIETLEELILAPDASTERLQKHYAPRIDEQLKLQEDCTEKIKDIDADIEYYKGLHAETENDLTATKDAVETLKTVTGERRIELRKKLQIHIRKLVDKVLFYPAGMKYPIYNKMLEEIESMTVKQWPNKLKDIDGLTKLVGINPLTGKRTRNNKLIRNMRSCKVIFHGGGTLHFYDNHDDFAPALEPYIETDEHNYYTEETITRMADVMGRERNELKAKYQQIGLAKPNEEGQK